MKAESRQIPQKLAARLKFFTVFVAWFDFNIFGCMHNLKQTYNSVLNIMA